MNIEYVPQLAKRRELRITRTPWLIIGALATQLVITETHASAGQTSLARKQLTLPAAELKKSWHRRMSPDVMVLSTVVFVTSGTTFSIPLNWGPTNTVICIGAGSKGQNGGACTGGFGGGAGAFATKSNILGLTPGGTTPITIGAQNSGTDTNFSSGQVIAKAATANSRTAGAAASCTPSTGAFSGGTGGTGTAGACAGAGGGGGGAGGPFAAGNNGATGITGGQGDGTHGGAGGVASGGIGQPGGAGAEYTATVGGTAGSGGGGGGGSGIGAGGSGGNYGAGGGGGVNAVGGNGAPGLIVVTYTPLPPFGYVRKRVYLRR